MNEPVRLTLYGDFNCPYCAVASARCAALERNGRAIIDWRAVEHAPELPVLGRELVGTPRAALMAELDEIRALCTAEEADLLTLPPVLVNTRRATLAYAATPPVLRSALRVSAFSAYWAASANLGDPEILASLGATGEDHSTAGNWRAEWLALPQPIVPAMVLPNGYVSRGLGALSRLAGFASVSEGGESPCFAHLFDAPPGV